MKLRRSKNRVAMLKTTVTSKWREIICWFFFFFFKVGVVFVFGMVGLMLNNMHPPSPSSSHPPSSILSSTIHHPLIHHPPSTILLHPPSSSHCYTPCNTAPELQSLLPLDLSSFQDPYCISITFLSSILTTNLNSILRTPYT